jgi:hypothetical protein
MSELTASLNPEQKQRCVRALASVSAITESLAELHDSLLDVRAVLRVALHLTERFIDNKNSPRPDWAGEVTELLIKEMGIVN